MKEEKNTFQKYFKKGYEKKKIHHFLAFPTFLKFFRYIRLQSSSNQKIQYMKNFVISSLFDGCFAISSQSSIKKYQKSSHLVAFLPGVSTGLWHQHSGCNSQKISKYSLQKYQRSNQDTLIVQRPTVREGDWVQSGDLLADCASSLGGELCLGKNIFIAYMPWQGYNYEDAILISERLVSEDIYTSIHIESYEVETRKTKFTGFSS